MLVLTSVTNAQWSQAGLNSYNIYTVEVNNTTIFAGTWGYNLYRSTDLGINWEVCNNGIPNHSITTIATTNSNVYVYNSDGIWHSVNNGNNWINRNSSTLPVSRGVYCLTGKSSYIFVGTDTGVYRGNAAGPSWVRMSNGLPNGTVRAISLTVSGLNIFAGTNVGLYLSTNNGANWVIANTGLPSGYSVGCLATLGSNLFVQTGGRLFKSVNNGVNWDSINLPESSLRGKVLSLFATNGDNLFMGTTNGFVYRTTNSGVNWNNISTGLPTTHINKMFILNNYMFLGTGLGNDNSGVFKGLASGIVTSFNPQSEAINTYSLSQNYPNPWNPTTTIKYSIPKSGLVTLKVYDITGKGIATLLNENQSPGTYSIDFQGAELSSGIYFYRLQAGNYSDTKQMILIK